MKEGGSSDVKCAYEGSGRKKQGGGGGSPLRVFFRASPLICPLIILEKKRGRATGDKKPPKSDPVASLALEASTPGWCIGAFLTTDEYKVSNDSL